MNTMHGGPQIADWSTLEPADCKFAHNELDAHSYHVQHQPIPKFRKSGRSSQTTGCGKTRCCGHGMLKATPAPFVQRSTADRSSGRRHTISRAPAESMVARADGKAVFGSLSRLPREGSWTVAHRIWKSRDCRPAGQGVGGPALALECACRRCSATEYRRERLMNRSPCRCDAAFRLRRRRRTVP